LGGRVAIADQVTSRYTEADYADFVHTGPGTLAGRYMRTFWQPVSRADDLPPGRAKPIRIMSEDFTLYRGESGAAHLVAFRCAHRGTQLSTGWVEGDSIRCFYHGWKYDANGRCIEQPAEPTPFCERIRVRSYPTEEYLGIIFAYLGEGQAPPLPRYPAMEKPGVFRLGVSLIACNFFNVLDNDSTHGEFAHSRGRPRTPARQSVEETEWGLAEISTYPDGWQRVKQWGMPNVDRIDAPAQDDWPTGYDTVSWKVPVDDEHTYHFSQHLMRDPKFHLERAGYSSELVEEILTGKLRIQDLYEDPDPSISLTPLEHSICQVGQGPIADRAQENLGASDIVVITFRKLWTRELQALADGRPLRQWQYSDDLLLSPRWEQSRRWTNPAIPTAS